MKLNSICFFCVLIVTLYSCVNNNQEKSETKPMTKNHLYEESRLLDETVNFPE